LGQVEVQCLWEFVYVKLFGCAVGSCRIGRNSKEFTVFQLTDMPPMQKLMIQQFCFGVTAVRASRTRQRFWLISVHLDRRLRRGWRRRWRPRRRRRPLGAGRLASRQVLATLTVADVTSYLLGKGEGCVATRTPVAHHPTIT